MIRTISELTGLHILTNTGQYKEPYLPAETFDLEAQALADQWILESREGIDGTSVKPGFIKTAVERESLAPMQQKVTRAAALTSKATGLTIATHTAAAVAAMRFSVLSSPLALIRTGGSSCTHNTSRTRICS